MLDKKYKILMIEDDLDQIQLYGAKFRLENYNFDFSETGEEGYKKSIEQKPDIILLDVVLYDSGGVEILKKLKQDQRTKNIPVVVFSNLDKRELVDKALKLGAIDYIIKSKVVPAEIVKKVAEIAKRIK
ncbi:MAG: response regulator [Patescibacteria group bacterium]|jgi:PleD family two-component response regulator